MQILFFALAFLVVVVPAQSAEQSGSRPFKGRVHAIPGLIEAEHFDVGKAGVAYADADEKNRGADYREPTQVDIEKRSDASNGHGIGWTRAGEWVIYSVEVKTAGTYRIEIPVASKKPGGEFHIEMDGRDVTGPIAVPDTGSWQKLETVVHRNVQLKPGRFLMKVSMDRNGASGSIADIDCFRFIKE